MAKPKYKYDEDIPLSDSLLAAIGYVATQWGHLEDTVGCLLAFMLDVNHHDFRAITSNLTAISKVDSFLATADLYLTGKNLATVQGFGKRAKGQAGERNRIVHGFWYPTKNPNVAERLIYVARDGGFRRDREEVSASRMLGTGREIAALRREIQEFHDRVSAYRRARRKASKQKR